MAPPYSSSSSTTISQEPTPACLKRIHAELKSLSTSTSTHTKTETHSPSPSSSSPPLTTTSPPTLFSLHPISDTSLLNWTAVLPGPSDSAYSSGLWSLSITIPPTYPYTPPSIKFVTPICHPNISFPGGEICLDLLKANNNTINGGNTGAGGNSSSNGGGTGGAGAGVGAGGGGSWTPAYTLEKCMEAIQMLLKYPEIDSPLNVDVAGLLKGGDRVGGESLVRYWCEEFKYRG